MSGIIPSYIYTYIKMGTMKKLIMDEIKLEKIEKIKSTTEIIEFIRPYYPGLHIREKKIEEVEISLLNIYIKMLGKITSYSPDNMRQFLTDYLLKFEIRNIKEIILSIIMGTKIEEKRKYNILLIATFLDNVEFMEGLLKIVNLDEIQFYMRGTKYYEIFREGIHYYKENNEIFVLLTFLDQFFFKNMVKRKKFYKKREKEIITLFVDYTTELYNLNLIFRGINYGIDKKFLSQFLVNNYLFLNEKKINCLLLSKNIIEFTSKINNYYMKIKNLKKNLNYLKINEENLMLLIENLYYNFYFKKFQLEISDIEYITIYKILELLIKKEREIKFYVLPNIIKIFQERMKISY